MGTMMSHSCTPAMESFVLQPRFENVAFLFFFSRRLEEVGEERSRVSVAVPACAVPSRKEEVSDDESPAFVSAYLSVPAWMTRPRVARRGRHKAPRLFAKPL
ncbi:hypothetical protein MRX96_058319 [Rhipicephalus microplus]